MSEIRGIVILYRGSEPTGFDIQNLKNVIKAFGEANTNVDVSCMSQSEISANIISSRLIPSCDTKNDFNEEENAIIYIATKFQDSLSQNPSSERFKAFVSQFSGYVAAAAITGADEEMVNALKIISSKPVWNIRAQIRASYRISNQILEAISRVGRAVLDV